MEKVLQFLLLIGLLYLPVHSIGQGVNDGNKGVRIYIVVKDDYAHFPLSGVKVVVGAKDTVITNNLGTTAFYTAIPSKGITLAFYHPEYGSACAKLSLGSIMEDENPTIVFEMSHISTLGCLGTADFCSPNLPKGVTCKVMDCK